MSRCHRRNSGVAGEEDVKVVAEIADLCKGGLTPATPATLLTDAQAVRWDENDKGPEYSKDAAVFGGDCGETADASSGKTPIWSDDATSEAESFSNASSCDGGMSTRSRKKRGKMGLSVMHTMGMVPSEALHIMVNNHGDLRTHYKVEEKVLGEGSFGKVTRAFVRATGAARAAKAISKEKMKEKMVVLKDEIAIMKMVDHPNLIMLNEIFEDKENLYLVMELCEGGHLQGRLKRIGQCTELQAGVVMQQIFRAMFYLHARRICHRDLKLENCLLAVRGPIERNRVKVSDLGLSCIFKPKVMMTARVGTLRYMAPEVLNRRYTHACDLWSCGVMLYQLLCGYLPFAGDEAEIKGGRVSFGTAEWCDISEDALLLVGALLNKSVKSRATAKQALEHKWIERVVPKSEAIKITTNVVKKLRGFRQLNKLKQAALTVAASLLSEEDICASRELFLSLDKDGDGTISVLELKARLLTSRKVVQDVEGIFEDVDSADRGLKDFTYTEFLAATFERESCLTAEICKAAFSAFDRNGDGDLSMSELADGRLLGHLSLEELAQTLEELDSNGDNCIDFEEFQTMLKSD